MKKYYQITQVGNSLFATLPKKLVEQLNLKSGDKVFYEIIPGKKKVILNIVPQRKKSNKDTPIKSLEQEDKEWLKETAGSLTVK